MLKIKREIGKINVNFKNFNGNNRNHVRRSKGAVKDSHVRRSKGAVKRISHMSGAVRVETECPDHIVSCDAVKSYDEK